ncbi:hypothetical protein XANCAGTX0491_002068 [Xanthoria calcicola]
MQDTDTPVNKTAISNIKTSCEQALEDEYDYIWVDTCCIIKESSAEVSKGVNSMFRWYASITIGYTYPFDVDCSAADKTLDRDLIQQILMVLAWLDPPGTTRT